MPPGDFTVGVEEEFAIVDALTGELRPGARRLLPGAREALGEEVQPELNLSQIETGTPVCRTLDQVRAELVRLRRQVREVAEPAGCRVISAGTHPDARWEDQGVNPTKERYRYLEEEYQLVAREQLVNGCHVHIGIRDPDLAIATLDRTRLWLSPVMALAANSPFWEGVDSGYASYRAQVWARWPLTGMPEPLGSRAAFDELVASLATTGLIRDASFLYWDVRPSARFPTLEFRATDACSTVDEAVMVAGLWRALARTCAAEAEAGGPPPSVRSELVEAAKWRASRHGLDERLVDLTTARAVPAAEAVHSLLSHLRPALEDHGDWDEVSALVELTLARGNGAARQRAAYARSGDLGAVIDLLVDETAAGS